MTSRLLRTFGAVLLMVLSVVTLQTTTGDAAVAASDSDLGLVSSVLYTVDPAGSAVHIVSTFVLSELKPDSKSGYFYFTGFTGYAEANVTNLAVTEDGKTLKFTTEVSDKFQRIDVTFARRLRYQKPQTVSFTYDLASSPRERPAMPRGSMPRTQRSRCSRSVRQTHRRSRSSPQRVHPRHPGRWTDHLRRG